MIAWRSRVPALAMVAMGLSGCFVGVKIGADGNELSTPDASSPADASIVDSGSPVRDSGLTPPIDSGPGDSGVVVELDAGPVTDDAGNVSHDAGSPAGTEDCGEVWACELQCSAGDATCRSDCQAKGTASAQRVAGALATCIDTVCPSENGGVCSSASQQCSMCEGGALANGCSVLYGACEGETFDAGRPPPVDAGMPVRDGGPPPRDGGMTSSDAGTPGVDDCFEVEICSAYCPTSACKQQCLSMGTQTAQTDFEDFTSCVNKACPAGDGGVCDQNAGEYDAGACSTCQNDVDDPNQPCFQYALNCYPSQCASNTNCSAPTPLCNTQENFCVQCLTNSDCPSGQACVGAVCEPADLSCVSVFYCASGCMDTTCTGDCVGAGTPSARTDFEGYMSCQNAVCPTTNGGVCDTTSSAYSMADCNNCISMAQGGTCNAQIEACLENCHSSSDCMFDPTKTACDTATDTCVECALNSDCPSGSICASNVCIKTCNSAQDCSMGETCMNGICVAP